MNRWSVSVVLRNTALFLAFLGISWAYPVSASSSSLRRNAVVVAVEKASPAVVNISTTIKERVNPFFPFSGDQFFRDFFPDLFTREYTRTSLGSGVIIDGRNGYIVTNHHVVSRATDIKIITADKEEYHAKILGSDPRSDLAVLQVKADKVLPEIAMGDSDDLMIGETVIAIGNPFGLSHTVTTGVVSALDRSVRTEDIIYRHFIQTDASINPGNSGGPLLNIDGELIGINTAIYQKAQGIGFAIPINKVKRIVKELIRSGEVRFPWMGVEIQELTPELRSHFGLDSSSTGVLVSDVTPSSPAAHAGIERGDILLELEGIPISSPSEYREALSEFTASDLISVTIFKRGRRVRLSLQLAPFPLKLALRLVERRLGILVEEAPYSGKRPYGEGRGVSIKKVKRGSEAERVGLQPGDLILKVNDIPIKGLKEFKEAISRYHHMPSITLLVQRGPYGYSITLPF